MVKVTLSPRGTGRRDIDLSSHNIPDLWHIAQAQKDERAKQAILEVWQLAHDLKDHILKEAGYTV